jgi:uncharacterized protein (TIGR03437 family)
MCLEMVELKMPVQRYEAAGVSSCEAVLFTVSGSVRFDTRSVILVFAVLLSVGANAPAADPTLPAAIQNVFRFGAPGLVLGAAFDAAGNLYLAGNASAGFVGLITPRPPAPTTLLGPCGGNVDVYVMKISGPLSPSTSQVVYLTGIGGSGDDRIGGMTVDPSGNVFLAGVTNSSDFPTTQGSFQPTSGSGGGFLLKLDPSGKKLVYSTFLDQGGTSAGALTIDRSGNAYVGGATSGITFPTTAGAYQRSVIPQGAGAVSTVGFISKFDASGATLMNSTLIGEPSPSGSVSVTSVAVSDTGIIHISGSLGPGFPSTRDAAYSSGPGFLARFSPTASTLLYSTPLPFAPSEMKLDRAGSSYMVGSQLIKIDVTGQIGYVAVNTPGSSLIVLDDGSAVVAGVTVSANFPTKDTLEPCAPNLPQELQFRTRFPVGSEVGGAGMLTTLDRLGNITFSTLLSGPNFTSIDAVALDPGGSLYAVGLTGTTLFPGGPVIDSSSGAEFVFKIDLSAVPHGLPAPSCLVSGASFNYAPATAGMIATLFGSNLGPTIGVQYQFDVNGLVATELDGTTLTVGGIPAPILYVQDKQINFVVPQRLSGSTTSVCVTRSSVQACIFAFTAREWPAIFCMSSCNSNAGFAILNQDGTLNTPSNPAARGSVIQIFGTGMGPYDRSLADGSIVAPPLANLSSPVQATFAGYGCFLSLFGLPCALPGTVVFAGAAPFEVVGVDQINVLIPDTAYPQYPGSTVSLTLQRAGLTASASVAVK